MTINKTNLQKRLSKIAFEVTQNAKTEGPFTGKYFNFFEKGIYQCICCNKIYLILIKNLNQIQGGLVFLRL